MSDEQTQLIPEDTRKNNVGKPPAGDGSLIAVDSSQNNERVDGQHDLRGLGEVEPLCLPDGKMESFFKGLAIATSLGVNTAAMFWQFGGAWVEMIRQLNLKHVDPESTNSWSLLVGICSAAGKDFLMFYMNYALFVSVVTYINRKEWKLVSEIKTLQQKIQEAQNKATKNNEVWTTEMQMDVTYNHYRVSTYLNEHHYKKWLFARYFIGTIPAVMFGLLNFLMAKSYIETVNGLQRLNIHPPQAVLTIAEYGDADKYYWTHAAAGTSFLSNIASSPFVVLFALMVMENMYIDYWKIQNARDSRRYWISVATGMLTFGTTTLGFYYGFVDLVRNHIARDYITQDPALRATIAGLGYFFMVMLAWAVTFDGGRRLGHFLYDAPSNMSKLISKPKAANFGKLFLGMFVCLLALSVSGLGAMPSVFQADTALGVVKTFTLQAIVALLSALLASVLMEFEPIKKCMESTANIATCDKFKDSCDPIIEEVTDSDIDDDVDAARCSWKKCAPKSLRDCISHTFSGGKNTRGGGESSTDSSSDDFERGAFNSQPKQARVSSCSII